MEVVWAGVDHEANTNARVKEQNDKVHPHTYINKQISLIFNCVTPDSVSIASLTHQLYITPH